MDSAPKYSHNILPIREKDREFSPITSGQTRPFLIDETQSITAWITLKEQNKHSWDSFLVEQIGDQQRETLLTTSVSLTSALREAINFERQNENRPCAYHSTLDFHLSRPDLNHIYYLANHHGKRITPSGQVENIKSSFVQILPTDACDLLQRPDYISSLSTYVQASLPDTINMICPAMRTPEVRAAVYGALLHENYFTEALAATRPVHNFLQQNPNLAFATFWKLLDHPEEIQTFDLYGFKFKEFFLQGWQNQAYFLPPVNENKSEALPLSQSFIGKCAATLPAEKFQIILDLDIPLWDTCNEKNSVIARAYQANNIDNFKLLIDHGEFEKMIRLDGQELLYSQFIERTIHDQKSWATHLILKKYPFFSHYLGDDKTPLGLSILLSPANTEFAEQLLNDQNLMSWRSLHGDSVLNILCRAGKSDLLRSQPNLAEIIELSGHKTQEFPEFHLPETPEQRDLENQQRLKQTRAALSARFNKPLFQ